MTTRRFAPVLLLAVSAVALQGCGPGLLVDPTPSTQDAVHQLFDGGSHADRALNALTSGQLPEAERQALVALRIDPKNPYALYVAGMVYQSTARYDLARQYYQALIATQPQVTIVVQSAGQPQVRSLIDLAQANLASIDGLTGRYTPHTIAESGRTLMPPLAGEPQPAYPAGGFVPAGPLVAQPLATTTPAGANAAEFNVSNRFRLLKRLLDDGLITADDYNRRRAANLGALMPYASVATPPARNLDRPPPNDAAVIDRLKSLSNQLEARAITPAELATERAVILDGLLPAQPRDLEPPPAPLTDVIAAAAAVGRVERLRNAGLLQPDEAARERAAIERQLDGGPRVSSAAPVRQHARTHRRASSASSAKSGGGGKGPAGLILATAPSQDEARAAWERLQAKYPEELGAMNATFRPSDAKMQWRVVAGPVANRTEAARLCKALKLYRQSCMVGGF